MFRLLARAFDSAFDRAWSHKLRFFGMFIVIVTLTYGVLYTIDLIPEAPEEDAYAASSSRQSNDTDEQDTIPTPTVPEPTDSMPSRLIIDALERDVAIQNPLSTDIPTLDNALLSGAVRHPQSTDLLSEGTVFLFGHSSYLPVVYNKNFQAFNGVQNLKWGDTIRIQSSDYEYVYRVDRVYEVKASVAEVQIDTYGKKLTLVTCNTFGEKEDRYIVEATRIDEYPLKNGQPEG